VCTVAHYKKMKDWFVFLTQLNIMWIVIGGLCLQLWQLLKETLLQLLMQLGNLAQHLALPGSPSKFLPNWKIQHLMSPLLQRIWWILWLSCINEGGLLGNHLCWRICWIWLKKRRLGTHHTDLKEVTPRLWLRSVIRWLCRIGRL